MTDQPGTGKADRTPSVAALLRDPSPWSAWMDIGQPPLAGIRYAALMVRELPVVRLIDTLGPALLVADEEGQALVEQRLRENPLQDGEIFGFETWLHIWDDCAHAPYERAMQHTAARLATTDDLKLFATIMASEEADLTATIWFFLKGIQHWASNFGDPYKVDAEARWLVELLSDELAGPEGSGDDDPLALLFTWLYRGGSVCLHRLAGMDKWIAAG